MDRIKIIEKYQAYWGKKTQSALPTDPLTRLLTNRATPLAAPFSLTGAYRTATFLKITRHRVTSRSPRATGRTMREKQDVEGLREGHPGESDRGCGRALVGDAHWGGGCDCVGDDGDGGGGGHARRPCVSRRSTPARSRAPGSPHLTWSPHGARSRGPPLLARQGHAQKDSWGCRVHPRPNAGTPPPECQSAFQWNRRRTVATGFAAHEVSR